MDNTYTWTASVASTRTAKNIPATVATTSEPNPARGSITVVDRVTLTCTSSVGGSFTDQIILPDPVAQDTAITASSPNSAILDAAKAAIGLGGISRYEDGADRAAALERIDPPLSINIPGESTPSTIRNVRELRQFADREQRVWRVLLGVNEQTHVGVGRAIATQKNWTVELVNATNELQDARDQTKRLVVLAKLKSLFAKIEEGSVLVSTSVNAEKLLALSAKEPLAGAVRLARLLNGADNRHPQQLDISMTRAVAADLLDERDLAASIEAYDFQFAEKRDELASIVAEATSQFDDFASRMAKAVADGQNAGVKITEDGRKRIEQLDQDISASKDAISGLATQFQAKFSAEVENAKNHINKLRTDTESDIETFRAALRSQMGLKEPAIYWRKKARNHTWAMWGGIISFLVLVGSLVAFAVYEAPKILRELPRDTAGNLYLAELIVFTIPALAYFWLMRYAGRFFVANHSAAADARLRATMAETFLALAAARESGIGDAERLIILQALFRGHPQSRDEDAPPSNLLDIITAVTSAKKG